MSSIYKEAGIQNGGFRIRFRDTAAVRWLQAGLPIEDVANLLGNSVRIVERHYSPWVQSRQDRLNERVRAAWDQVRMESLS